MRWMLMLCCIAGLLLPFSFFQEIDPGQTAPLVPSAWVHYTMDDLAVDVTQFEPIRGRYLQVMLDLEGRGEVQSRGFVHLEIDRALHSGVWDGQYPMRVTPWREPGLVVDWKIQNGLYNAYDRVLTDSRLSTILRAMPAGPYGLRMGSTLERVHAHIQAAPDEPDSTVAVIRRHLPHGAVNVLTVPYVLSAMDLQPGDRFTLPGFALIGGPEGTGRRWRGAFEVKAVTQRTIRGNVHAITEVMQWAVDPGRIDSLFGDVPPPQPGERFTRHYISDHAPYFIGRGDYLTPQEGQPARIREQLDLIDWAPIPLPTADLIEGDVWEVDSTANIFFQLKPEHIPQVLLSRDP